MDKLVKAIYKSQEAQDLERQTAAKDRSRQRLLKRFTRVSNALNSPHPLAVLAPMRRYHQSCLLYRLERNRIKHRHHAVKRLLKRYLKTSLTDAYKLFDIKHP